MPLSRAIYYSTLLHAGSHAERDELMRSIVLQARANNAKQDITGALFEAGVSVVQVLEGRRPQLTDLLGKILNDERHTQVRLIDFSVISERRFDTWSMHHYADDGFLEKIINEQKRSEREVDAILSPKELVSVLCFITKNHECHRLDLVGA